MSPSAGSSYTPRNLSSFCKVYKFCPREFILHRSASVSQHKRTRQLLDLARLEARVSAEDLMEVVVLVSRLEQHTRSLYTRMLTMRERSWAGLRQGCTDRMEELADVFGGKQKLSRSTIHFHFVKLES